MKVVIPNISTKYLGEYTLIKEVSNSFIVEKLETETLYSGADHKYLVERAIAGDNKALGTVTRECGDQTFTKNVFIKHNEGNFDYRTCETRKKLTLENVLDCIANKNINIFDYPRKDIATIQGEVIDRETESYSVDANLLNQNYTLSDILGLVSIPSRAGEGFFIESGSIIAKTLVVQDGIFNETYFKHKISVIVTYVRIRSSTKIDDFWILIPGDTDYYYSQVTDSTFFLERTEIYPLQVGQSWDKWYYAGKENLYQQIEISNAVSLNTVLLDLFSCTSKTLISNFFGINSDATQPNNNKYTWALKYAQNVMIIQSYDIIKEDAQEDSFGISGKIKSKKLLSNISNAFYLRTVVDGDNIRLEHVSYFTNKGIDLTGEDYEITPLDLNRESINTETFSFAKETPTFGFYKTVIEYELNDIYSEENNEPTTCDSILTDIFGSLNNPDLLDSGFESYFYLMCTDGSQILELNKPFSMNELVINLHDVHRPMKTATINDELVTFGGYSVGFTGEITIKSNVINWDNLQPMMSVKTNEGTFLIDSISIDENDYIKLKIKK